MTAGFFPAGRLAVAAGVSLPLAYLPPPQSRPNTLAVERLTCATRQLGVNAAHLNTRA